MNNATSQCLVYDWTLFFKNLAFQNHHHRQCSFSHAIRSMLWQWYVSFHHHLFHTYSSSFALMNRRDLFYHPFLVMLYWERKKRWMKIWECIIQLTFRVLFSRLERCIPNFWNRFWLKAKRSYLFSPKINIMMSNNRNNSHVPCRRIDQVW